MTDNILPPEVILVYPKLVDGFKEGGGAVGVPYSILCVAAEICDDYRIAILDQRMDDDWQRTLAGLITDRTLCVGISSMTGSQIKNALDVASEVRRISPLTPIVWGGVHVSIMPEQSLRDACVDFVIKGEGELAFRELLEAFKGVRKFESIHGLYFKKDGRVVANPLRKMMDIESLKPIPWHLVDAERYMMKKQLTTETRRELDLGETSRGCPFACTFCYNRTKTGFTWRAMSPEKTVAIIEDAILRFRIDGFWLRDDNFFTDYRRAEKVLDLMESKSIRLPWYCPGIRIDTVNKMPEPLFRKLVAAGIRRFRIGVESGNDKTLKLINKCITRKDIVAANLRLKSLKIPVEYTYIIGFPTESLAEMYDTVDLVLQLKRDNPFSISHNINLYSPYPGTELYPKALELGYREPDTLAGWAECHHLNMNFGNYSRRQRAIMQTINELSYYTAGFLYENLPWFVRLLSLPLRWWCEFRFRSKLFFSWRWDLDLLKFVRKVLFRV